MSRKPKPKSSELSPLDKVAANFLAAFEADVAANAVEVVQQLRQKSPVKYAEIASKLIATIEPKSNGFEQCNSMQEIGLRLLKSVGVNEYDATDDMIKEALEANNAFIARLEAIRDAAQGAMQ